MSSLHNTIYLGPGSPSSPPAPRKPPTLIFFITGNPGLIEFYRPFLNQLRNLLPREDAPDSEREFHLYGASLAGFQLGSEHEREPGIKVYGSGNPPFGLGEQIDRVVLQLTDAAKTFCDDHETRAQVILVGHSVGAYILLEIITRWQRMQLDERTQTPLQITGGICLFPTVVDIAQSANGRMMGPLLKLPGFPTFVHYLTRVLAWLPLWLVVLLVGGFTGMERGMADVTAAFLRSRHGVRQALHMARDEMREITNDRFTDTLWGTPSQEKDAKAIVDQTTEALSGHRNPSSAPPPPKLFFYFGHNDHWVSNRTRDKLIATRARAPQSTGPEGSRARACEASKPVMEVDGGGIPHGFCLRREHSRVVAEKVARWVREVERGT